MRSGWAHLRSTCYFGSLVVSILVLGFSSTIGRSEVRSGPVQSGALESWAAWSHALPSASQHPVCFKHFSIIGLSEVRSGVAQVEGTERLGSLVALFALGILVLGCSSIIGRSEVRSSWAQGQQSIGHLCSLVGAWSQALMQLGCIGCWSHPGLRSDLGSPRCP